MRVSIKKLYEKAYGKYGIGAFNVFNAEQVHGVFRGAAKAASPVIIQLTPVARDYIHPEMLEGILSAAGKIYPEVVFTVHLDHGNYSHCVNAIESGYYNSVMIDASHESFEENVRITSEIVEKAHARGIAVEAELGVLSGVEDHISIEEKYALYTNPGQAEEFVRRTNCDSLAVAAGTSHGAYKFSGGHGLQLNILGEIQKRMPGFPLVLHGASAVPIEEVSRINLAGGKIREDAKGAADNELISAIGLGVCKINIATDMRLIWTRVHREFFRDTPEKFDMVVPGREYMDQLEHFVVEKCKLLKSFNQNKI
jgi:fructose-bisphosphate aldolase, class II